MDTTPTRLPPSLKAIVWSIAFIVIGIILALSLGALESVIGSRGTNAAGVASNSSSSLLQAVVTCAAFLVSTWLIGVVGARLRLADLRWFPPRVGWIGAGIGFLLGAAPAIAALALGVPIGGASWVRDGGSLQAYWVGLGHTSVLLLPAAFAEELVFRGVPLVLLARVFGRWKAAIALSLLFGLAHLRNPEVTPLGVVNVALAGLFLSAAFFTRGGLWAATGAHLGWNLTLAGLGAPVSGLTIPMAYLDYLPGGPTWLTGGAFGPEGGLLATLTLGGAALAVIRWTTKETDA